MAKRIGSGDPDNMEARAAREYWSSLFVDFVRDNPADLRNKLLNYGYAIIRAGMARALVAYGLVPSIGLNHCSVTNAFNLADDLFEPFRPMVDSAARLRSEGRAKDADLTIDDRRAMAGVLMSDCRLGADRVTLLVATEKAAESLVQAMDSSSPALLRLPLLVEAGGRP
jgi:CRISPR-associated protein Cas1